VLRLGLIIGGIIGALVATLLQQPKQEPDALHDPEEGNIVDKVKYQVREAQIATQTEAKEKEAELLAEYEATLRHERKP